MLKKKKDQIKVHKDPEELTEVCDDAKGIENDQLLGLLPVKENGKHEVCFKTKLSVSDRTQQEEVSLQGKERGGDESSTGDGQTLPKGGHRLIQEEVGTEVEEQHHEGYLGQHQGDDQKQSL